MRKFSQIIFRPTSENSEEMHQNYISLSEYLTLSETLFLKLNKLLKTRNTKDKFNDV